MSVVYLHPRGTKANLDAKATAGTLVAGQVYLISDQNRLAVATSTTAYTALALQSEVSAGSVPSDSPTFTTALTLTNGTAAAVQTIKTTGAFDSYTQYERNSVNTIKVGDLGAGVGGQVQGIQQQISTGHVVLCGGASGGEVQLAASNQLSSPQVRVSSTQVSILGSDLSISPGKSLVTDTIKAYSTSIVFYSGVNEVCQINPANWQFVMPARMANYATASLPSASTVGVGALVYQTDGTAGLYMSNGTSWLGLALTSGALTPSSVASTGAITSSGTTGIGYATGAGGTVTQATSRTTGVTLSKLSGAITLFSTTTTAGLVNTFTVTNTLVAATDTVEVCVKSATAGIYFTSVTAVAAGSFKISVYTPAAVGTAEAPVLNFNVIKGVAA